MTKPNQEPNNKKTERNRQKKAKYRKKKKLQRQNKPTKRPFLKTCTKRRWTWKVLKTPLLTLNQKRKLFKIHQLHSIKESNLALIHNLQAQLFISTFKNKESTIKSTTKSTSTSSTVSEIENSISTLQQENNQLQLRITSLQISEKMEHKNRKTKLIKISRNHGHSLQKRLNNLNSQLRTFNTFSQQRYSLCSYNLANILELEEKLRQKQHLLQEQEKLNNLDKIHNFTTTELPKELNNLLNKGTNFIPTLDTSGTRSLQKSITTEVNQALCSIIRKQTSTTGKQKVQRISHRFKPYSKVNPCSLLKQELNKPHYNLHIVDYVHNTTA